MRYVRGAEGMAVMGGEGTKTSGGSSPSAEQVLRQPARPQLDDRRAQRAGSGPGVWLLPGDQEDAEPTTYPVFVAEPRPRVVGMKLET